MPKYWPGAAKISSAFRLLFAWAAYNLVNFFRLELPQPWRSARRSAQIETLRARLFKIGALIRPDARCIRIHLASGYPFHDLFHSVSLALNSS